MNSAPSDFRVARLAFPFSLWFSLWFAAAWSTLSGNAFAQQAKSDREPYDVVVYGGTSAGITAAIQTVRMGKRVLLLEPSGHLGGLTSSGLGWTDTGDKRVIGGLAREFYRRVKAHYDRAESWPFEQRSEYTRYRSADDAMWTFEPRVASQIFADLLREHGIEPLLHQRLERSKPGAVVKRGATIESIQLESGRRVAGRMFIDATYE
ncbi:MAG: FAD-dependent oxidoreductase, partial [Planctomycetales bacterium]|nr:FAD-dependent oxidoreductase [Planctomycetales bacterium]